MILEIPYEDLYELRYVKQLQVKEIAAIYNVGLPAIANRLHKYKITLPGNQPTKEFLVEMHHIKRIGIKKMAKELRVNSNTIKKWFMDYGIEMNNCRKPLPTPKQIRKTENEQLRKDSSREDIKLSGARRKKDIVCNYKVGDPIDIYGEVRTVIQVTKELIVTRGRFTESYRIADL